MNDASVPEVLRLDSRPLPGWQCPNCFGLGHLCDGMCSIGPDARTYRPATPCAFCKGKGRVNIVPLDD